MKRTGFIAKIRDSPAEVQTDRLQTLSEYIVVKTSLLLIILHVFSALGQGDIADRSQLRNTNLRISGVKEQDAGKFTCEVDGTAREHTLLVVSGKQKK